MRKLLHKIPIFSGLDSDSLSQIVPLFKEKTYRSGDMLFRENTLGDRLYIIVDGEIEISKREKSQEETTRLALRRRGDIFGEMSLLDEEPRFASAKAVKDTKVLELSKPDFLTMLDQYPLIAYQIMKVLSSRLRQSDLHMVDELRKKNRQLSEAYHNLKAYAEALTQSNQELNEAKSFLERIISTSPYAIVVTEPDNTISLFNKTAEREYRYASEQVVGKSVGFLRGRANLLDLDELIERALQEEGIWQGEVIARTRDGEPFVAHAVICNIPDQTGKTSAILHIYKNITNERNLSQQALDLERMATRGEMAAEVAHELNNYLQIALGNLELVSCEMTTDMDRCLERRIPRMRTEMEKIGCFIKNLMDFAVPKSVKRALDLVNFVEKELAFLRPQNRFNDIEFRTDPHKKLPLVQADPNQLQQLLYNLMNNAADALRPVSDRRRVIDIVLRHLPDQAQVEIEIGDNGIGLSKDRLPKVFKERFTTKEEGHGFGLLSVRRVVESHRGTIRVESVAGVGTTFTARFPVKQPQATPDQNPASSRQPACQEK